MKIYRTRIKKFSGTHYAEVYKKAFAFYSQIKKRTKRRPYVRSAYFNKDKIFLGLFWSHLFERNLRDRVRRLKYFACALELIQKSMAEPISKQNPNRPSEILHRFYGLTPEDKYFFVQIKEDKRTNQKWFMSVFPDEP